MSHKTPIPHEYYNLNNKSNEDLLLPTPPLPLRPLLHKNNPPAPSQQWRANLRKARPNHLPRQHPRALRIPLPNLQEINILNPRWKIEYLCHLLLGRAIDSTLIQQLCHNIETSQYQWTRLWFPTNVSSLIFSKYPRNLIDIALYRNNLFYMLENGEVKVNQVSQ